VFLIKEKFSMTGVFNVPQHICQGDWGIKIDMTQAYYHVSMASNSCRYLKFVLNGKVYMFKVLPFGVHSAPFAFTKLGDTIVLHCHSLAIRIIIYLDDVLILAASADICRQHAQLVIDLLCTLGLTINATKSVLVPTQRIFFLGFFWDTQTLTCHLPPEKLDNLQFWVKEALKKTLVTMHLLHRLNGIFNSTRLAVCNARARYRGVQRMILDLYHNEKDMTMEIPLSDWARNDLLFWANLRLEDCHLSFARIPLLPTISLATDASDTGWGYILRGLVRKGVWPPSQKILPIAIREFLAVEKALHQNELLVKNQHISWQVDSQTVLLYWRNQGGVSNVSLCKQVVKLLLWCQERAIIMVPKWVRSQENLHPDLLSRGRDMPDWQLAPRVVKSIFAKFGLPQVDLMATARSTHLPQYYTTESNDREALQVDAMAQDWDQFGKNYIFPPEPLLPRVLEKIASCSLDTCFLLVTPYWRSRHWFPSLLQMAGQLPWRLPTWTTSIRDLAGDPDQPRPGQLRLVVWRLFGEATSPMTFPLGLDISATKAGRRAQRQLLTQLGEGDPPAVQPTRWSHLPRLAYTS
jgi:hypothetical protein